MSDFTAAQFAALFKPVADADQFTFLDPPFQFNAPDVAKYPAEVSGNYLLKSLCRRLGWPSLSDRRLLDFGCGTRLARTIVNLAIDIGGYAGVDVNEASISWLRSEIRDPRLRFEPLDMLNPLYSANGSSSVDPDALRKRGLVDFDAACMFSVITHQTPPAANLIFSMLHRCVKLSGHLYFTAFLDDATPDYVEADPSQPCRISTYNPCYLAEIVSKAGWAVEAVHAKSPFQQPAFVCRRMAHQ